MRKKEVTPICSHSLQLQPNVKLTAAQERILCQIVHCEDWSNEKAKEIYKDDKTTFNYVLNNVTNILAFDDLDKYMERVGVFFPESHKNSLWQNNHVRILNAISTLTYDKGRFPTRVEISSKTNLSKQTVNKHLREYFNSELYNSKKDEYIVLREAVLANVFTLSMQGDVRASKVFLDATNQFVEPPKIKNQQNNYIQINGFTITQEELKQLPAGKITKLHRLLSTISKPISKQ